MATIAVTGASGGLGRGVVRALLERGAAPTDVVAVVRDPAKVTDLAAAGVQVRVADYDDPDALTAAFAGVDVLVFVSGSAPGHRITQHTNIVTAAAADGVERIVYTSAPQADTSGFALVDDHRATEALLADARPAATVLRNSWYVENYLRDLPGTLARGTVVGSAGDGRVSVALRAEYAEAAAAAALDDTTAGRTFELGGDPVTLAEVYAALGAAAGGSVTYRDVSPDEHMAALQDAGMPDGLAGFLVATDEATRRGELASDPADLDALLGRPHTPLAEAFAVAVAAAG